VKRLREEPPPGTLIADLEYWNTATKDGKSIMGRLAKLHSQFTGTKFVF
jgi:hypothetical protein